MALGDDCKNPLLTTFGFTGLASPTTVSGLKFCKGLQKGQSCCSADTVNAIQDKAKALSDKLSAIVAARDKAIVETREKIIPGLQQSLKDLKTGSDKALTAIKAAQGPPPNNTNNTNRTGGAGMNMTNPPPPPPPNNTNGTNRTGDAGMNMTNPPPPPPNNTNDTNRTGDAGMNMTNPPPPPPNNTNDTNRTGGAGMNMTNPPPPPPPNNTNDTNRTGGAGMNMTNPPPPNRTNNSGRPAPFSNDQASKIAESLQKIAQKAVDGLPDIKNGFNDFQKSRTSCVVELIKLQSSAWCLACDPGYAAKGVTADSIPLSTRVCKRLQSACYKFVVGAATQSAILSVKSISSMIDQVASSLKKIGNGDSTGLSDLASAVEGNNTNSSAPKDDSTRPVGIPDNCTESQCNWICNNFFTKGQVDQSALSAGGPTSDPTATEDDSNTTSTRLLVEEGSFVRNMLSKKRVLAVAEWDPDQDEAGVTVTFADDPAGVKTADTNQNAGIVKASIICIFALLAVLLF